MFEAFRKALAFDEPIPPFATRFPDRLESILNSVRQTYGGQYLNPTILDASSAYLNQLVRGHPFQNGNKRMGVLFTHIFLWSHEIDFTFTSNELYNLAIQIVLASTHGISNDATKTWCKTVIANFTKELS